MFGQAYEFSANTRAHADYEPLRLWLTSADAPAPDALADAKFDLSRLREVTPRQRSLYRACIGLIVRHGARDFYAGDRLTWTNVHDKDIEDHHVFPRNLLDTDPRFSDVTAVERDSVLNRTLIDQPTNASIRDKPPAQYFAATGIA